MHLVTFHLCLFDQRSRGTFKIQDPVLWFLFPKAEHYQSKYLNEKAGKYSFSTGFTLFTSAQWFHQTL